jgi:hypothetical protein
VELFGRDEVEEKTNGRLLLTHGSKRVWACAGEFRLEDQRTGVVSEIPCAEVFRMLRERIAAIMDHEIPENFQASFRIDWWRSEMPVDPADVLNS